MDDVGWSIYIKYYGYKFCFYIFVKGKMFFLSIWNWNIVFLYVNVGFEGCIDDILKFKDYFCRFIIDGYVFGILIFVNVWL